MNDELAFLARRRSVPPRLMTGPGPDEAQLDTLLTIAARVPDHGKLAPWRFIVIEGEARHRMGEVIAAAFQADEPGAEPEKIAAERARLARAPLVVAVVSTARPHVKIPEWEQVLSAGAVCMNLIVAANLLGYSTSWLTEWYSFDRRVLEALGVGPHEELAGFIHIGRASEVPADRQRPNLAEIVTRL
jgi:nitroreductase